MNVSGLSLRVMVKFIPQRHYYCSVIQLMMCDGCACSNSFLYALAPLMLGECRKRNNRQSGFVVRKNTLYILYYLLTGIASENALEKKIWRAYNTRIMDSGVYRHVEPGAMYNDNTKLRHNYASWPGGGQVVYPRRRAVVK